MSTINLTAHGLTAGQRVVFSDIAPVGTGLEADVVYTVLATGLTTDAFQVSETGNESDPLSLVANVTSASMIIVPETTDTDPDTASYIAISDSNDVQAPPQPLSTPEIATGTSSTVAGLIRLYIELPTYPDAAQRIRMMEVQVTHAFDGSSLPLWETSIVFNLPVGSNTMSIPALSLTRYNIRYRAQDIFGTYSDWSPVKDVTTEAGFDGKNPADGSVGVTTIQDGAIRTNHIYSQSVEAKHLAATIILASLIKTAPEGRRVELDEFGIRLWGLEGASEVLLVNIPTNGEAVYVKGEITASSFISSELATFYGTNTFPAASVTTLFGGIAAPSNTPTLTATVDQLPLTTTPTGVSSAAGIAWDPTGGVSGTGSYWIAADPTVSPYHVAHEFNADGTYRRSISRTGTTTTATDTIGSTSHVADTTDATSGSTWSQIGTPLTMPRAGRVTKVSAYLAGYSGSCVCRMQLWATDGNQIASSANFTAASRTFSNGNDVRYEMSLSSPESIASGVTFWAGFARESSGEGFFWSKNDGTGYTTKKGNNLFGDMLTWSTDSDSKPNIYVTYEYDVSTVKETAAMIGVATDGTYVYTLDTNGRLWKYNRSTLAWVSDVDMSANITGTKSKAGLFFYNATGSDPRLVITTTTGTGTGVYPKFVQLLTSLTLDTSFSVATGPTFSGTTDTFRGGVYLPDPLNSNTFTFWIATTSAVYAYQWSGSAFSNTANRDFGATYATSGLAHDGTQFRGWNTSNPTKVTTFSTWDWTTGGQVFWVGYSWYDSDAGGTGTHETTCGPRSSITMRRREKLTVTNASIPDAGGSDDPDNVRVYMIQNAADFSAGGGKRQAEGTGTSRTLSSYNSGGTADPTLNGFGTGSAAEMKSAVSGWSLKGDGTVTIVDGGPGLKIGDDSKLTDVDIADTLGIYGQQNAANGGIVFGSGHDTNLYRSAADTLKTDDTFVAPNIRAGQVTITGDGVLSYKTATITFSPAMPATPRVVACVSTNTRYWFTTLSSISSSGFTCLITRKDDQVFSNAVTVDWIAISGVGS